MPISPPEDVSRPAWRVACLCAAWCRTCDDYRAVMVDIARAHPGVDFAWVDIEDHADALDDPDGAAEDIEDFPTLLISRTGQAHFFGTVTPQPGVLARLVEQALAGELPPVADPRARHMAGAVEALVQAAPQAVRIA